MHQRWTNKALFSETIYLYLCMSYIIVIISFGDTLHSEIISAIYSDILYLFHACLIFSNARYTHILYPTMSFVRVPLYLIYIINRPIYLSISTIHKTWYRNQPALAWPKATNNSA